MADEVTAWGKWDCTRCGQKDISGEEKRCPSCGDPREQHELDAMRPPDDAAFAAGGITDADALALAKDGPDWSCGYCGSNNRASAKTCSSCGGDRDGQLMSPSALDELDALKAEERALRQRRRRKIVRALLVVVGLLALLIAWCTVDHDEEGQVVGLRWEHTTTLQRWQDVTRGDWKTSVRERPEVPPRGGRGEVAGVDVIGCHSKHHHDESYACGTEHYTTTESYTCGSTQSCSTRSNRNGSFTRSCTSRPKSCTRSVSKTRTKYCARPIFREWCDFTTQDWIDVRAETVRGEGHEGLRFAEVATSGDRERTVQAGEYTVTFSYGEDGEVYNKSLPRGDYDTWRYGDPVIVTVDRLNGATGVHRREAR